MPYTSTLQNANAKQIYIKCCYHIYTYIKYIQKYAPSSYNFGHSIIKMYFQEFNCDVFTYDVTTYTTQFI